MAKVAKSGALSTRQRWYREVYLFSPHWRKLRKAKLAKSPLCEDCGKLPSYDVHHVIYRKLFDVTIADLRSLCRSCHETRHRNRARAEARNRAVKNAFNVMDLIKFRRRQFKIDLARRRKLGRMMADGATRRA